MADGIDHFWQRERTTVEGRLERLIETNRFTIAVVFPVMGAIILLASTWGLLPPQLAFNPLLLFFGVTVMRAPLLVGILPVLNRRAVAFVGVLAIYSWGIEWVGVRTGWPYGAFEYGVSLGPMVLGEIPLLLPVLFLPIAINAYLLCILLLERTAIRRQLFLPIAILATITLDFVLDPAAVGIGFWTFEDRGRYYGVPWRNYGGWVLSGTVAVVGIHLAFDREQLIERLHDCQFMLDDLISFVILWGIVNLLLLQLIPAAIAVAVGLGLWWVDRLDLIVATGPGTDQATPGER